MGMLWGTMGGALGGGESAVRGQGGLMRCQPERALLDIPHTAYWEPLASFGRRAWHLSQWPPAASLIYYGRGPCCVSSLFLLHKKAPALQWRHAL